MPEPEGRCRDCVKGCDKQFYERLQCKRKKNHGEWTWPDGWCPSFECKPDVADRIASRWYGPDAEVVCTNKGMISSLADVVREELAKEKP